MGTLGRRNAKDTYFIVDENGKIVDYVRNKYMALVIQSKLNGKGSLNRKVKIEKNPKYKEEEEDNRNI